MLVLLVRGYYYLLGRCDGDGDGGKNTNTTAALTSQLSSDLAVAQCTLHQNTLHHITNINIYNGCPG